MCLGVPGQILTIAGDDPITRTGRVNFGGVVKEVNLAFTPDATVGDYVVVHVGFAISQVDEEEAGIVFDYLRQMDELDELTAGETADNRPQTAVQIPPSAVSSPPSRPQGAGA
jgi:hydrogenase expression/formation protein HypC